MARHHIYSESDELAQKLRDKGHVEWADKVESAIAGGCTGTEIMMHLRWELRRLKVDLSSSDSEINALVTTLVNHINSTLR